MPEARHHEALARQWEMLRLLPRGRPGSTVSEIRSSLSDAGFRVSKRTIERDLNDLSRVFPIACNDKSRPYGWYWMEGAEVNLPAITLADALSLRIVEDTLRLLLPAAILANLEPRFRQAKSKLEALANNNPSARWIDKVRQVQPTLPMLLPVIDDQVLRLVQNALLEERQVDVQYQPPWEETARALRLHPLALVQRGTVTYLVATAFNYEDIRLYAVHRMREVTLTDDPVVTPDHFDLDDYIAQGKLQFGTGENFCLDAEVNSDLAGILIETPLCADQRIDQINSSCYRIKASLVDSWQLRWWLLAQGEAIVIKNPVWLRQWLYATASRVVRKHND